MENVPAEHRKQVAFEPAGENGKLTGKYPALHDGRLGIDWLVVLFGAGNSAAAERVTRRIVSMACARWRGVRVAGPKRDARV